MRTSKSRIVLLLAVAVLASCHNSERDIFVDPDTSAVGEALSNQHVTAFAEDSTGYIWVGTERGLNRYDAHVFHQYYYNANDSASIPSNNILCLFTASDGRLWVGTENGLCYYGDKDDFHRIDCGQDYAIVHQIWENDEGRIFVNMIEHLYEYDSATDRLKLVIERFDPGHQFVNHCFTDDEGHIWSVITGCVRCFNGRTLELERTIRTGVKPHYAYLCRNGELWLAQGQTLTIIDTRTGGTMNAATRPVPPPDGIISHIYSVDEKTSYIYTDRGLALYAHGRQTLVREGEKGFPFQAPAHDITQMFMDSHGNLWIGFRAHGLVVRNTRAQRFDSAPALTSLLRDVSVVSMSQAADGRLWMTTATNELMSYDADAGLSRVATDGLFRKPLPDVLPATVMAGHSGSSLWIIYDQQLYEVSAGSQAVAAGKLLHHTEISPGVACMAEDGDHTVWVGTGSDVIYCKAEGERLFRPVRLGLKSMTAVLTICPLSDGNLACGLALSKPILFNTKTHEVTEIGPDDAQGTSYQTTCITEDRDGRVWLGTRNRGVLVWHRGGGRTVPLARLSCEEVCDIREDDDGHIWISTMKGLNRYDPCEGTMTSFYRADGLGGNQFNQRSSVRLATGELAFGGTHGVTIFNPRFKADRQATPLVFEDLMLGNRRVKAGTRCMARRLSEQPDIRLRYDQNSFTISFAALDYRFRGDARYAYKLEGYNRDWVETRSTSAAFLNVPAGRYRLRVKTLDGEGTSPTGAAACPEPAEGTLGVTVAAAPWNSWWAWLAYAVMLAAAVGVSVRGRLRILRQQRAAQQLEQEKAQEQHINRMNKSFYANISHEFRTPLTMIAGPATLLYDAAAPGSRQQQLAATIRRNAERMLGLVDQLMDTSRLDDDALRLQVTPTDIIDVIRQSIEMFRIPIREKGITLRTYGIEDRFVVPIDADKLDKVLANLFSNALKFTPQGGVIACTFDAADGLVTISVSDNGVQIPDAETERIFERYYQVANHHNYGTGIGLYYCRRLLTLHHGEIRCANLPEGGVRFTVTLPAGDVYTPDEHAPAPPAAQAERFPLDVPADEPTTPDEAGERIMLIDDDPDIIAYLTLLLTPRYAVSHAYDAPTAIERIRTEMPDIVLSDVTMPAVDGYQLCRRLKDDDATCHIPVVLVTARTTKDDQLTGLATGADAYITKPFDPDCLQALIRSLLDNRRRVQRLVSASTTTAAIGDDALTAHDKQFMDDLYQLMERELSNADLNINAITKELYLSRTKLYYKIKALTGEKPHEFFKKFKLNRAAEMLRSGNYNVSEVSYMTGFSSLTVFSRNFKAQFGVTPTEYMKQH